MFRSHLIVDEVHTNLQIAMKALTLETFTARLAIIRPHITLLSKHFHGVNSIKLRFKCNDCGTKFKSSSHDQLYGGGNGCKVCGYASQKAGQTKSDKKYKEQAIEKGWRPLEPYVNDSTYIKHSCVKCGKERKLRPTFVVAKAVSCPCQRQRWRGHYSPISIRWLEELSKKYRIKIEHAANGGERVLFTPEGRMLKVDGFNARKKLVFEFHGDCYHGNPELYKPKQECHPFNRKTARELYRATVARQKIIETMGYTVIFVWQHDYQKKNQLFSGQNRLNR